MARCASLTSHGFRRLVRVDFGTPMGSETGFVRPAIIVVADSFLRRLDIVAMITGMP